MLDLGWWTTPPSRRSAHTATWVVVAAIAGYATAAALVLDGALQYVTAVALAGGLLVVARRSGSTWRQLGLGLGQVPAGLGWGLGVGAGAVVLIVVAAFAPGTEDFFSDDRVAEATVGDVIVDSVVRIPLATALFEELVFRGVLFAVLMRHLRPVLALLVASAIFGVWHVAPALGFADANTGSPVSGDWAVVAGTVVLTAAAGAFLTWLRVRADSLVAPVLVHWAVNATALVTAFAVR